LKHSGSSLEDSNQDVSLKHSGSSLEDSNQLASSNEEDVWSNDADGSLEDARCCSDEEHTAVGVSSNAAAATMQLSDEDEEVCGSSDRHCCSDDKEWDRGERKRERERRERERERMSGSESG